MFFISINIYKLGDFMVLNFIYKVITPIYSLLELKLVNALDHRWKFTLFLWK